MSDLPKDPEAAGPQQRHVEIGVAAFMVLLGVVTVVGSLKVGTGWGAEGPQSGFFPFWDKRPPGGGGRIPKSWKLSASWRNGPNRGLSTATAKPPASSSIGCPPRSPKNDAT